ncbi:extracellular solute-binding protein [Bifidobacterium felsineum]|nr:extracellular solute-binding protein [Bifidobacterium felsineum]
MKTATKAIASLASLAMLTSLAACGNTPGSASSNGNATAWGISDANFAPAKESFELWNKNHSDQQISTEYFANDALKEKMRTAIGSGNAPTFVYSWGGASLKDYADSGAIVDLTDELADTVNDRVFESVAQGGYIGDKLYATPLLGAQPVVLYFNKSVLNDAGVSEAPQTWTELLDAVAKIKASGKTPIALAGGSKWPYLMWAAYLVDRIGGPEVFQGVMDGKADAWSDPAVSQAMEMIQDLVKAGAFGDIYTSLTSDDRKDTSMLVNGTVGMELMGSWVYPDLQSLSTDFAANDLGFAPFPAVEGGKGDINDLTGNLANYWSVSAKANAKQRETAIAYLKDQTYTDAMVDKMLDIGAVPPVKDIEQKVKDADTKVGFYTWVYEAMSSAPAFQLSWDQAIPAAQAEAVLNNLEQVFLLTQTPDQFVDAMNATLK